jgi:hypothetical protein
VHKRPDATPTDRKIEAAITAAESKPTPIEIIEAKIALLKRPDRMVGIAFPADISDLEWLALLDALIEIGDQIRARRPDSRIVTLGKN